MKITEGVKIISRISKHELCDFGTWKRYLLWQLINKNRYKQMDVEWVNGSKLHIAQGRPTATGNYYLGLLEYESMAFWMHYLRPEDYFVDIGANIGVYSVLGGIMGSAGIAIEPASDTSDILRCNININNLFQVEVLQAGVSDKREELRFSKGNDSTNHILSDDEVGEYEKILVQPPDKILQDKIEISGIKLDVEGGEEAVIKGADNCLRNLNCNFIICEVFSDEELCSMIKGYGFDMYSYNPIERTLERTSQAGMNNSIFIRDIDFARERVKTADPIDVYGKKI